MLFYGGIAFCYFLMIPIAVNWLISQGAELTQTLSVTRYVSFIGWFLVGAGLIFELPLVLVFLIKIDILTMKQLRRQWRIVYIVILVLCAIITPDWSHSSIEKQTQHYFHPSLSQDNKHYPQSEPAPQDLSRLQERSLFQ